MKTITLGGLSLLLFGTALFAQFQTPIRSLLRVHSNYSQDGHGLRLIDEDVFIATDRSVERIGSLAQNGNLLPPSWLHERTVAIGSRTAFATLSALLADNRVSQQAGACSVAQTAAPSSGTFEITWYSRDVRKSVFVVEINGTTPPCSQEVLNILNGIEAYEAAAGV
jgi:hypothetical protein